MIIYGNSISPFVKKVLVYCAERGIAVDNKVIGFDNPDPGFQEASPFRKIPAMREDDGFTLADSSAIVHYLEAQNPEGGLIPADARARAKTIWFDEAGDTVIAAAGGKIFFNRVVCPLFLGRPGDLAMADAAERDELPPLLDWLETQITDSGYLVGDRFSLADIAIACPFVNFQHCDIRPDPATHPRLSAWLETMFARPSFAMIAGERAFIDKMRARQSQDA